MPRRQGIGRNAGLGTRTSNWGGDAMPSGQCPFCSLPQARIIDGDELAVVVRDGYPVTPGHTLVIPRRHVGSIFDLTPEELQAVWRLLERSRIALAREFAAEAFNIGVNDGPAAGQTVPHMHMHLIPRRSGDVADPRGGVRWVIPDKARYWP